MARKKKDPIVAAVLGGAGFLLGLGAVFLFGTKRGEKYRKQLGEFSADFLDNLADGCREIKKELIK